MYLLLQCTCRILSTVFWPLIAMLQLPAISKQCNISTTDDWLHWTTCLNLYNNVSKKLGKLYNIWVQMVYLPFLWSGQLRRKQKVTCFHPHRRRRRHTLLIHYGKFSFVTLLLLYTQVRNTHMHKQDLHTCINVWRLRPKQLGVRCLAHRRLGRAQEVNWQLSSYQSTLHILLLSPRPVVLTLALTKCMWVTSFFSVTEPQPCAVLSRYRESASTASSNIWLLHLNGVCYFSSKFNIITSVFPAFIWKTNSNSTCTDML